MAASAKEKAYNLKDSYVAGLIEGGATAPAPTMPTQDMGETASMLINLDDNSITGTNDNDNSVYAVRNGGMYRATNRTRNEMFNTTDVANPVSSAPDNSFASRRMTNLPPKVQYDVNKGINERKYR